ncbi:MAG: ATP-binding protein [Nitrososphaeria archaeon]
MNHWWTEKEVRRDFSPATYRELYSEVEKDIERRQVQAIVGLRRTGKSTILFQTIDRLIKIKKINSRNILYCSFDEPELREKRIEDVLKEYSRITNVDYKKEKIYLLLDEVQKSRHWVSSTKLVYDNLKNIKIFISGSASLDIFAEVKKESSG